MKFQIDPRVAHLTATQLAALTDRYHAGERAIDLVTEYQVRCAPNQLYRLLPPTVLRDRQCDICGAPLIQLRRSRPDATGSGDIVCSVCAHRVDGPCGCAVCDRDRSEQRQREVMRCRAEQEAYCCARWSYAERVRAPDDLTFAEAVALLSVVRCGGWRADETVGAVGYSAVPLAPAGELGMQFMTSLVRAGVIAPDPDSPTEAFTASDDDLPAFPYVTYWRILTPSPTALVRHIERLAETGEWPQAWREELGDLQLTLALAECREFADYCLLERGLPEAPEVASEALFQNLLRDFSVAQCIRIIWAGVYATSDFLVRKRANRRHAANYFIGACQRWADRARTEAWTIKPGFRNNNYRRSQLSHVLYDVFLGIGEKGFIEPLGV